MSPPACNILSSSRSRIRSGRCSASGLRTAWSANGRSVSAGVGIGAFIICLPSKQTAGYVILFGVLVTLRNNLDLFPLPWLSGGVVSDPHPGAGGRIRLRLEPGERRAGGARRRVSAQFGRGQRGVRVHRLRDGRSWWRRSEASDRAPAASRWKRSPIRMPHPSPGRKAREVE